MAHPAQSRARLALAATALTEPARHVAALTQPPEPAPCVRRVYGGYAAVEDGFRRRPPPTVLGTGLPFELATAVGATRRAEQLERSGRTFFRGGLLRVLARNGCSTLDSCR